LDAYAEFEDRSGRDETAAELRRQAGLIRRRETQAVPRASGRTAPGLLLGGGELARVAGFFARLGRSGRGGGPAGLLEIVGFDQDPVDRPLRRQIDVGALGRADEVA